MCAQVACTGSEALEAKYETEVGADAATIGATLGLTIEENPTFELSSSNIEEEEDDDSGGCGDGCVGGIIGGLIGCVFCVFGGIWKGHYMRKKQQQLQLQERQVEKSTTTLKEIDMPAQGLPAPQLSETDNKV